MKKKLAPSSKPKLRKHHGPKRFMFHSYCKALRQDFGKLGLLDKYHDYESFKLACSARGIRNGYEKMWVSYSIIPSKSGKDAYLNNLIK